MPAARSTSLLFPACVMSCSKEREAKLSGADPAADRIGSNALTAAALFLPAARYTFASSGVFSFFSTLRPASAGRKGSAHFPFFSRSPSSAINIRATFLYGHGTFSRNTRGRRSPYQFECTYGNFELVVQIRLVLAQNCNGRAAVSRERDNDRRDEAHLHMGRSCEMSSSLLHSFLSAHSETLATTSSLASSGYGTFK